MRESEFAVYRHWRGNRADLGSHGLLFELGNITSRFEGRAGI